MASVTFPVGRHKVRYRGNRRFVLIEARPEPILRVWHEDRGTFGYIDGHPNYRSYVSAEHERDLAESYVGVNGGEIQYFSAYAYVEKRSDAYATLVKEATRRANRGPVAGRRFYIGDCSTGEVEEVRL